MWNIKIVPFPMNYAHPWVFLQNPLFLLFYCHIFKHWLLTNFFWPLKKVCFQTEILGKFVSIYIFCFILLFTSSSSCRKDQLPFYIFLQVVILPVQVYIWEIRHHSLVCRCGLSDILYILVFFFKLYFLQAILRPPCVMHQRPMLNYYFCFLGVVETLPGMKQGMKTQQQQQQQQQINK